MFKCLEISHVCCMGDFAHVQNFRSNTRATRAFFRLNEKIGVVAKLNEISAKFPDLKKPAFRSRDLVIFSFYMERAHVFN